MLAVVSLLFSAHQLVLDVELVAGDSLTLVRDVVGSFLISPVKGWASGHALLHAGIPCPDPSEADKASGLLVFRRWGFFGSAVGYVPAAAARSSAISHPGLYIRVILCGWSTTHFWLKEADEVLRNVKRT